MSEQKQFKTARFSGFDRNDVMEYVAVIKEREASLMHELDSAKSDNADLKKKLEFSLTNMEELKRDSQKRQDELKKEIAELKTRLKESDERTENAELKLGAAMMDVRRYADTIIDETTDKINMMSADADASVNDNLASIKEISEQLDDCSSRIEELFGRMRSINESLETRLRSFAGSLERDSEQVRRDFYGSAAEDERIGMLEKKVAKLRRRPKSVEEN